MPAGRKIPLKLFGMNFGMSLIIIIIPHRRILVNIIMECFDKRLGCPRSERNVQNHATPVCLKLFGNIVSTLA